MEAETGTRERTGTQTETRGEVQRHRQRHGLGQELETFRKGHRKGHGEGQGKQCCGAEIICFGSSSGFDIEKVLALAPEPAPTSLW